MSVPEPFAILGLDPATSDLAAIKAAYARLVKQHRPDRDPAGFRRVRDAYEFCISPAGTAYMRAVRPAAAPWPTAALQPTAAPWPSSDAPAPPPAAADDSADLDDLLDARDREPGRTGVRTLSAVIEGWHDAGDWPRLRRFGRRVLVRLARGGADDDVQLALLLADRLALHEAGLAGDLLTAVFPHTSGVADLDLRLHIGGVLAGMDEEVRGELLAALRRGAAEPALAQRLRAAFAGLPYDQPTRDLIEQRLPALWSRSAFPPAAQRPEPAPEPPPAAKPPGGLRIGAVILAGVVGGLGALSGRVAGWLGSHPSPPPSRPVAPAVAGSPAAVGGSSSTLAAPAP